MGLNRKLAADEREIYRGFEQTLRHPGLDLFPNPRISALIRG